MRASVSVFFFSLILVVLGDDAVSDPADSFRGIRGSPGSVVVSRAGSGPVLFGYGWCLSGRFAPSIV